MLLYSRTGDVWWPKLSADGRFIAFGGGGIHGEAPPTLRVVHLQSKTEIVLGYGRAIHWIGPDEVTWIKPIDNENAERWHATIFVDNNIVRVMNASKTTDPTHLVACNEFVAANGHWAGWLDAGKRLVYDGEPISYKAHGVAISSGYLLSREEVGGEHMFVLRGSGDDVTLLPLPPRANRFTISPTGIIGYGYWWDPHIIGPDGRDVDVTVTPWTQESAPWITAPIAGMPWAWTASARPSDHAGLVHGRPIGARECVTIEHFPAVSLDIISDPQYFLVAGSDDTGHLQVHLVPSDAPRALVVDVGVVVLPDPPKPPDPPKETPVKLDPDYVATIFEFTAKFPCPGWDEDVLRETWTPRLIEQLAFTHRHAGFGWKARDRNAPPSSDVICIRSGGHTLGWDIIPGAGTDGWKLDPARADSMNLDDQYFFELPAQNHLGEAPEEPGDPGDPHDPGPVPTPPAKPTDLTPVINEFDQTQALLSQLVMAVTMQADATNRLADTIGRIEAHDLVIADLLRQNMAVAADLRKRLDMAIKVKL